jgi:hypothetical protein
MGNGGAEPEQGNEEIEREKRKRKEKEKKPFLSPQKLKFLTTSLECSLAYSCESEKA